MSALVAALTFFSLIVQKPRKCSPFQRANALSAVMAIKSEETVKHWKKRLLVDMPREALQQPNPALLPLWEYSERIRINSIDL